MDGAHVSAATDGGRLPFRINGTSVASSPSGFGQPTRSGLFEQLLNLPVQTQPAPTEPPTYAEPSSSPAAEASDWPTEQEAATSESSAVDSAEAATEEEEPTETTDDPQAVVQGPLQPTAIVDQKLAGQVAQPGVATGASDEEVASETSAVTEVEATQVAADASQPQAELSTEKGLAETQGDATQPTTDVVDLDQGEQAVVRGDTSASGDAAEEAQSIAAEQVETPADARAAESTSAAAETTQDRASEGGQAGDSVAVESERSPREDRADLRTSRERLRRDKWYQADERATPRSADNSEQSQNALEPSARQSAELATATPSAPQEFAAQLGQASQPTSTVSTVPVSASLNPPTTAVPASTSAGEVAASDLTAGSRGSLAVMEAAGIDPGGAVEISEGHQSTAGKSARDVPANQATTEQPDVLTQAERVRMVQRVARSFARLGPTGGEINIRLHPPQLGSLNVQVRLEGKTMTAKLSTESSEAREAILESLPVLRGRLAEQGYEIASFQVEVADTAGQGGSTHSQAQSDQQPFEQQSQQRQVDYRRLSVQQRTAVDRAYPALTTHAAGGLSMAGFDMQA